MTPRLKRIGRLIELRGRAADAARVALAQAVAATAVRRAEERAAEAAWEAAMDAEHPRSVGDLEDTHDAIQALRHMLERARDEVRAAEISETAHRHHVQEAEKDRKKLEVWRDAMHETLTADAARLERRATDETAARIRKT